MGFPQDPAALKVSAAFGANLNSDLDTLTYTDITKYVSPYVVITRGRIGDTSRTQPGQVDLRLRNPLGRFSPENITGPNYGNLRINTPVKVELKPVSTFLNRCIAYIPEWPVRWTGPDINDYIPISAYGYTSTIGQDDLTVSWVRRHFEPAAIEGCYWPVEDGSDASMVAPTQAAMPSMVISGLVDLGTYTGTYVRSQPIATLRAGGSLTGLVQPYADGSNYYRSLHNIPTGGLTNGADLIYLSFSSGYKLRVAYGTGGTLTTTLELAGAVVDTVGPISYALDGTDFPITIDLVQSGADVNYTLATFGSFAHTFTSVTLGHCAQVRIGGGTVSAEGFSVGHIFIDDTAVGGYTYPNGAASISWLPYSYATAESGLTPPTSAFATVCHEALIPFDNVFPAADTQHVGPQPAGSTLDMLTRCEEAGEGQMIDRRNGYVGLDILSTRYNLGVAMTLPYKDLMELEPNSGSRDVVNVVTVARSTASGSGSSATSEVLSGPLGSDRVTGIGPRRRRYSRNLSTDDALPNHAGWLTYSQTINEQRFRILLNLRDKPSYVTQWLACDIGSRVQITSPPAIQTGPAPLDLILEGYVETIDGVEWNVEMWLMPYAPYMAVEIESGPDSTSRIAADSVLAAAYAATDTSLSVTSTNASARWIDSATYASKFPITIVIAGERMTCTAITGTTATQTFTVTRGLDGVTKALPISSPVRVYRQAAIAL
jgi:hypothetical protein